MHAKKCVHEVVHTWSFILSCSFFRRSFYRLNCTVNRNNKSEYSCAVYTVCVCVLCEAGWGTDLVMERFNSWHSHFGVSLSKKLCSSLFTQLFKWEPSGLVSTGEAAHLAVTSMGIWCKLGKQISNCCH